MGASEANAWLEVLQRLQALGFLGGVLLGAGGFAWAVRHHWFVSWQEFERRSKSLERLCKAEEEKVILLRAELEKREGLYIASLAEMRTSNNQLHAEKERVLGQLAENNHEVYRITEALADLRLAILSRGQP
jgi:hypothetical protein